MRTRRLIRQRPIVWIAAAVAVLTSPAAGVRNYAQDAGPGVQQMLPGQSATLLPDGRWLVIGGWHADGSVVPPAASDGRGGGVPLPANLLHQRIAHTATVLPDGSVLIAGGVGRDGTPIGVVERFDPQSATFSIVDAPALDRAWHSATLLPDGRVLFAGGVADGRTLADALLWDPSSGDAASAPLAAPRARHTAQLLSDGRVQLTGGAAGDGQVTDEAIDPVTRATSPALASTDSAFFVAASTPQHGAAGVETDVRVVVQFSTPVRVRTVTARTVTLSDDRGQLVPAHTVAAEGGMLLFVRPYVALDEGRAYTLTLDGVSAAGGQRLSATVEFTTRGGRDAAQPIDDEAWAPDLRGRDGWRTGRAQSPWEQIPPLMAGPGVTALSGRLLRLNGQPLPGATLKVGQQQTTSDRTGRFLVEAIEAGRHELVIDGRSASSGGRVYGVFKVGVQVRAGQTNVLPFTSWMPRIDTHHAVTIPSPTSAETVVTTPAIPGLEVRLPAGTVIRDADHKVARHVSITPIPVDRPPFPLPAGVNVPIYFTIQPGGGYLESTGSGWPAGARVIYPNYHALKPATEVDFWNYDPEERGWFVYGLGAVTPDARRIEPRPGVVIYEFTGAMVGDPSFAPPEGPPPCNECEDGDPVDLATGLFVYRHTDLVLPDVTPIDLTRTYRTRDTRSRAFGIGSMHQYDIFIVGTTNPWTYADIVLPDGARVHYPRTSAGTNFSNAVFEHTSTPSRFYGSRISWNSQKAMWDLRFKDGTIWTFPDAEGVATPAQAAVVAIKDRFGNALTLQRDASARLTRITSPNGRFIDFTYDASSRITLARDNVGRTVGYEYDATGRLWKVTDPISGVTEYTYDTSHRMKTIKDPRNIVYLTNDYDLSGRVILQRQGDGSTYEFTYTTGAGGAITQTEVKDPRGIIRRVTFNPAGYWLTDTRAVGLAEQQTTTLERHPDTNLVTSETDALGRRTEFGYDARGNLDSVTRLAGTASAVTTSGVYDSTFNEIETVTDPLTHTTTYGYDSRGALTSITDPLGHTVTLTPNAAGQTASVTDASGTVGLTYLAGDLVGLVNAAGQSVQRLVDHAGRELTRTDALGNTSRREYNAVNLPLQLIDPLQATTTLAYDGNGNLLTVLDPRSGQTQYTYDAMDRVETRTDALLRVERYIYDRAGNLFQFIDRRGLVTTYHYDGLNRRTHAAFADGSSIAYTYDAGNRLRTIVDSVSGTTTLNYDDLDRITSEVTPRGSVAYTYDAADRRETMTVAGQPAVTYTYDDANRLTHVTQGASTAILAYDDADRRTSLTMPNGVVVEYGYDGASRLSSLTYRLSGVVVGTLTYAYDAAGRRTEVGGTLARVNLPQPVTSATYNAANQLTQWNGTTLTYDLNGNLATEGTRAYSWDARNRLAAIGGTIASAFVYDAAGRRVEKATASGAVGFLHDGRSTVQELSGATPTANLLNGQAIDELLVRTDGGGSSTLLADGLGSTVALTDAAGAFTTRYTYEPFGTTTASGASAGNTALFTGREGDGHGLMYYRARYYSPRLQRFISEDPARLSAGDPNFYAYVGNQPTGYVDPSGLGRAGVVIRIVRRVGNALREGRTVCTQAAQNARRRGADVAVDGADEAARRRAARQIEEGAFRNDPTAGRTMRHDPHRPGYRPHYQTDGRPGHTFYQGIPGAGLGGMIGRKTGMPLLGNLIDLINPLSDVQDILDLGQELFGG